MSSNLKVNKRSQKSFSVTRFSGFDGARVQITTARDSKKELDFTDKFFSNHLTHLLIQELSFHWDFDFQEMHEILELNESKNILDGSEPEVPEDFNILIILSILTLWRLNLLKSETGNAGILEIFLLLSLYFNPSKIFL